MPEFKTIQEIVERRTYLKGKFKGKFIGNLDFDKSDILHENFYDLEVIEGEIKSDSDSIRKWEDGSEFEEFISEEKFLTKLPEEIPCEVKYPDNSLKYFKVKLNEPKLSNYRLFNQQYEKDTIFGTIEGEISGYLKHFDTKEVIVEVEEKPIGIPVKPKPEVKIKTDLPTGRTETKGNYKRWEYFNKDGSTYWGDWKYQGKPKGGDFSLWDFIIGLFQFLLLLLFIIPLIFLLVRFFVPLLIIGAVALLLTFFKPVLTFLGKWLIRLLGLAFLLFFIAGVLSLFKTPVKKADPLTDTSIEEITEETIFPDSIITHSHIWADYLNKTYEGNIQVKVKDFKDSRYFRNNLHYSLNTPQEYNYLVSDIENTDKEKLSLLYSMLDSIRDANNLNEVQFAEVITSCVQYIPYSLILPSSCEAFRYNDSFIRSYLSNGGDCTAFVKFGIHSPVEFMATLKGDCDTRTLLLFCVLNHYGYDVAMLGSELYKHSILGINLPYKGIAKNINGKRYVVWETTDKGFKPGILPREISDMRYWSANLISNKNQPTV
jgi:hypothetical protein